MDVDTDIKMGVDKDVIMVICKIARIDMEENIKENSKASMSTKVKACINTEAKACINTEVKENVSIDLRLSTSKEANVWMGPKRSLRLCLTNSLANMIRKEVNTEVKENAVTLKVKMRRLDL